MPELLSSCLVPRCKSAGAVTVDVQNFLCERHASLVWEQVELRDARGFDLAIEGSESREYVRADARALRSAGKRQPTATGEIYFVRIGELIKIGWTTKLADRIRAYGPTAELLAHYPGSRADEAGLHRQLTPARFRGREWYSDIDIVRAFIAETLAKHGRPRFDRIPWAEPKTSNIKPRGRR